MMFYCDLWTELSAVCLYRFYQELDTLLLYYYYILLLLHKSLLCFSIKAKITESRLWFPVCIAEARDNGQYFMYRYLHITTTCVVSCEFDK